MLYSGYVALTIPFAFAIGALGHPPGRRRVYPAPASRADRLEPSSASACCSGARWSYTELVWGGYGPGTLSRNAALMPCALANPPSCISNMVQRSAGMLKVWNATLNRKKQPSSPSSRWPTARTFLVLSGVLPSIPRLRQQHGRAVHPRPDGVASSRLDRAVLIRGSTNGGRLSGSTRLDLARVGPFLVNNRCWSAGPWDSPVVPSSLDSRTLTATKSALAAPWFHHYNPQTGDLLVLFSRSEPLLAWRRVSGSRPAARLSCCRWRWAVVRRLGVGIFRRRRTALALAALAFACSLSRHRAGGGILNGAAGRKLPDRQEMPTALSGSVRPQPSPLRGYSSTSASPCMIRNRRLLELPRQPERELIRAKAPWSTGVL